MHVRPKARSRSARLAAAVVTVVAGVLTVAGCSGGVDGSAVREQAKPPVKCTVDECPELPVYSSKDVADSGVTSANAAQAVPAYMTAVLDDLDTTWQEWFAELNIDAIKPGRVLIEPGETFRSECAEPGDPTFTSDFPNAMFCTLDTQPDGDGAERKGSIVLPVQTFADLWEGKLFGMNASMLGDFTAATIIAHEYGHNVVWRLKDAYGLSTRQMPAGDDSELIADCFAGNWAATVFARDDLSIKEIAQAALLIVRIGDPEAGQGHGTSFERARALQRGFMSSLTAPGQGQPVTCLKNYWPQVLGS